MKAQRSYWTCQILGWGSYSLVGMWAAASQVGWNAEVTIGYPLYCLYSVALTHLLRHFVKRRGWLETPRRSRYFHLFAAAWLTGLVQAVLVVAISHAIAGSHSSFHDPRTAAYAGLGIANLTVG